VTTISESSEWLSANDPCTLELGSPWRIPTSSEWINIDEAGGWTTSTGSFNNALKIHPAGYLNTANGALTSRGANGDYWSINQYSATDGVDFTSNSAFCSVIPHSKVYGFSVRCIRGWLPVVYTATAGSITSTTATSGGTVSDEGDTPVTARGVCWGTSSGPTVALTTKTTDGSGTGIFTSNITGITENTTYYLRAYATSSTGTVYGNEITFTATQFSCGTSSLAISHSTVNGVAPVNKTVTYGTVSGIPGETSKCWITKNLGATQQATSATDGTESSAGWYWQFARKQGYKNDGQYRTPYLVWNANIDENSNWLAANDPCSIELGSAWRVPTTTEWTNVDGSSGGNWGNYSNTYASNLKIHAAGYLTIADGSLASRGVGGNYWSSTQNTTTLSPDLSISSSTSGMVNEHKDYGFTLRCIRGWLPAVTTTATSSVTVSSVVSGGNVTDEGAGTVTAKGLCWSTSASPTIAGNHTHEGTGTGTFTTNLSGLADNTTYYLRAYATSSIGTAYGNEVSFTTGAFTCGTSSISVFHVADTVSPAAKTTTYATVTNIAGETSKCWITKNLGATSQATSVSDVADAVAGWYWQFNRKQGYDHNGTSATPTWTISTINESSDWLIANDPCRIELGGLWRIPTKSEWNNIDSASTWTTWAAPYASNLKMHGAGYIDATTGARTDRGSHGYYWSSIQSNNTTGWLFDMGSAFSGLNNLNKAHGFSVRCIRGWLPVVTTASVSSITTTTATCGGTVTDDGGINITARGVCWSTTTGPTTALSTKTTDGTGPGTFTSSITGLAATTTYYVRSYATSSRGTVYGNEVVFTSAFPCGNNITKNHTAGTVAPVTKSVTYGTVSTTLFGGTKCAITKNLGATNQPTAIDDATEAAAGWYWQFNLKQGYKHDGTTRTPNTAWNTSMNENSNWISANDPCAIELGAGWRIPTQSEWANAAYGWNPWTTVFSSVLKLHEGGALGSSGALNGRGGSQGSGDYYASTQYNATNGYFLTFSYGGLFLTAINKYYGLSVRCVRD
jgi:hypothetical protein